MVSFKKNTTASGRQARRAQARRGVNEPACEVTLSEERGVRYLHFGTEWVQGAMRVAKPYALELEYQRHMMAVGSCVPEAREVVILGMGAGALAKFCWHHSPSARVRVVELFPQVVAVARQWFDVPEDERLQVIVQDALSYLKTGACPGAAQWLLVDLYDSEARGPVYDGLAFYAQCRLALSDPGVAAFNLFGGHFRSSFEEIAEAFSGAAIALPPTRAGNRIVLAYKGNDFDAMYASMGDCATVLGLRWGLPMSAWVRRGKRAGELSMADQGKLAFGRNERLECTLATQCVSKRLDAFTGKAV